MRVFVTGGAGYIGSVCVEELLNAGHRVTVFDNLSEGHRSAVDPRATFLEGDLLDRRSVRQVLKESQPDAVIHFGASALVGESMTIPGKYFRNNVANGLNLIEAALEARVSKVVFSSTCAIYGVPSVVPISESLPPEPINPYGESKLMFEKILHWYHRVHGLAFVALRYFNAAGASRRFGEHHRVETHLIPNVLRVALGQSPHCEIYGTNYPTPDGTCVRDYVHVVDLARAHLLALGAGKQGIYNLGNGEGYSVREVIQTCERISGRTIRTVEKPRRDGDPPRLVATADKAARDLGWTPQFPKLEQIVATAWQWHKDHPNGYPD